MPSVMDWGYFINFMLPHFFNYLINCDDSLATFCHVSLFFFTQNGSSSRLLEWNFEFCRKMTITLCFTFHFHTSARILVILLLRVPSLSLGDLPTPTFFLWWLSIFLPSFVALLVLTTWDPTGYPLSFMFVRLCFFVKRYCTCSSTQK